MSENTHLIGPRWLDGDGAPMVSENPATGEQIWSGQSASPELVNQAVRAARDSFFAWSDLAFDARAEILKAYANLLEERKTSLAETISRENGKPIWDSLGEVTAMTNKIAISIEAYLERTPTRVDGGTGERTALRHRPHGILAVFGPYNFPGHLPNGHIVPALLAGNTIVFKPSELTPQTAIEMGTLLREAGVPDGVLNIVQGGVATGQALSQHDDIDGLLFTGSAEVGALLHRQFGGQTEKILALELGGNNPLIVTDVSDPQAAALIVIQSAYISSGQRCTCARKLLVPKGPAGDAFLDVLSSQIDRIRVGTYDDDPAPFMGPLISNRAADHVLNAQTEWHAAGATLLRPTERLQEGRPFLSPGLVDVTHVKTLTDDEVFGPLLQVVRCEGLEDAIEISNATRFGLAAGLISTQAEDWELFRRRCRAGIVNWNKPLTGASSKAPFGGIGLSGNHRPSAYYAADYCAYPMASMEADDIVAPPLQGLS